MSNLIQGNVVKNTTAGASDVVINARRLNILTTVGNRWDPLFHLGITNCSGILKSFLETPSVQTIAFSAANNTTYSFTIIQYIPGTNNTSIATSKSFSYVSDSSATAAEIATAFVNAVNNSGMKVTASGSTSPITLTAQTGYPLFILSGTQNVTFADGMATFAPNATAALAITNVIAPHGTAATAIAGTNTVTVTTLAAHGLVPGDTVTIASTADFLMNQFANGNVLVDVTGVTAQVETVPTTTTFTLKDVQGNGVTNTGTITITANSVAFVQTASANTLVAGNSVAIAGVATATLNGGTGGTFRVGSTPSTSRFKIEGASLVGTNSGTITIALVAQESRGDGTKLLAQGVAGVTAGAVYSTTQIDFGNPAQQWMSNARSIAETVTLYANEGATNYEDFRQALDNALNGVLSGPPVNQVNPEIISVV